MRGCSCTPLHGQRSCRTLSSPMPVAAAIGTTMRGRHLHQSEWCPRHQVLRPRRLVAPGVEDQQQRARSGRLQQDPPRAIRDTTRVAAARCCGWQRSLPIGILHRQLLGIGVRLGRCPGPADLPDLVRGRVLGVVPGLLPDHAGVQHPPRRRGGRGHRSCAPPLTRPTCRGADITGGCQSPPAASAQMPARGVPTTRPRNVSTSQRRNHVASTTSLGTTASGLTRPAAPAGRDRRHARSVGEGARDGHPGHRQP
jgi:hypothetical protein